MNKEQLAINYVSKIMEAYQGQELSKDQVIILLKEAFMAGFDSVEGE